jgi:drug/metabolite transporter (DMT)-like permease
VPGIAYNGDPMKFTHPYVQSANMFIGELLCLGLYGIKLLIQRNQKDKGLPNPMSPGTQAAGVMKLKTNINPLLLAIPATFDLVGSSLMNLALTMIPASIYQMMRANIVIVTTLMSIIFLKRRYFRHHWSAVGSIFIGVTLVALSSILENKDSGYHENTNPFGILLVVIAQLFSGGLYIVEEKLLGDYYLDPFKVVGLEGLWGFLIMCCILPIL